MAEEKRSKASAIDRESSRTELSRPQRQLFLSLLPAALSDPTSALYLPDPLRISRR